MNQPNTTPAPDIDQLIDMHSQYSYEVNWRRANGQPVPQGLAQGLAETESIVSGYLGPRMATEALRMSEARQLQIHKHQKIQHVAQEVARQLKGHQESTKGIAGQRDGLTPEQMQQVRNGAETLKVPNDSGPKVMTRKETDAHYKARYDGLSEGNLQWYQNRRGTEAFTKMATKNRRDPAQLERMLDDYAQDSVTLGVSDRMARSQLEAERHNRNDPHYTPPAEKEIQVSYDDGRRMAIADAINNLGGNAVKDDPSDWISEGARENAAENSVIKQEYENAQAAKQGRPARETGDRRNDIIAAIDHHIGDAVEADADAG